MADITLEDVEYVADLARLELSADEKGQLVEQLGRILGYIEKLDELDTTDVEPTSHVLPMRNVMRADEARDGMARDEALGMAPASHEGYFEAPRVVE
ncbi:Asp-tRNA(Asn)/Glu-tRNA(Gln) amidotransferase subunit GatC [Candidatus Poribacteria bacterium]|jgi:aspartyl-tRNA(Asn)/glutamyl-tRNA(Gln) amidotransferase subunit C|nr:Asp-tRNA(Asn)/Glu-tRNA(Gln) amidotransferase subunit GatC [Candidatus Poribacteria bacterium]MBT5533986.1 Asp-tRNA(Asn)/Glu-tRNA(Gln) amidotransferase subunit GatC [Candidatus Poribacteria bacterium]MBT5713905.1 Asp-tRNA(Asn)/Glu-tRNA(Gln) amidotransferase subunit GatC [Candidatus Poribacteria bacterium]MBT7808721.1 Asp-tRNA(Asn)/Glu-tRNA(Gln) amidotransferase subunit GatC [Candidatus Poribacteria bacterium]